MLITFWPTVDNNCCYGKCFSLNVSDLFGGSAADQNFVKGVCLHESFF